MSALQPFTFACYHTTNRIIQRMYRPYQHELQASTMMLPEIVFITAFFALIFGIIMYMLPTYVVIGMLVGFSYSLAFQFYFAYQAVHDLNEQLSELVRSEN
jgi:hypothetical protein